MDTTHFDDEDNLLYVTKEVYVGQSAEGSVILVAKSIDEKPVYVEDFLRMTGTVIADSHDYPIVDELVDQMTGGVGTTTLSQTALLESSRPLWK